MRRLPILCALTLSALLGLAACGKEEEEIRPDTETVDAILVWAGEYAADGCGFILQTGLTEHKPTNENDIPAGYKTATPTPVEAEIINYNKQVEAHCGFRQTRMNSIRIVSLQKK